MRPLSMHLDVGSHFKITIAALLCLLCAAPEHAPSALSVELQGIASSACRSRDIKTKKDVAGPGQFETAEKGGERPFFPQY